MKMLLLIWDWIAQFIPTFLQLRNLNERLCFIVGRMQVIVFYVYERVQRFSPLLFRSIFRKSEVKIIILLFFFNYINPLIDEFFYVCGTILYTYHARQMKQYLKSK